MTGKKKSVSHDQIAKRAYELWQARGCPLGHGIDDWVAAEAELLGDAREGRRLPLKNFFAACFGRLRRKAA